MCSGARFRDCAAQGVCGCFRRGESALFRLSGSSSASDAQPLVDTGSHGLGQLSVETVVASRRSSAAAFLFAMDSGTMDSGTMDSAMDMEDYR